jgi:Uncharacterized proteins, homologs of lactam utilization protein B
MVKEGKAESADGKEIGVKADSICVHGDNPKAVQFAKRIREGLEASGVKVAPMRDFIK